jgi:hypothetical protein
MSRVVRADGRPYVSPPLAKNRKEANAALRQAFAKLRGPPLQKMRAVRAGPDLRPAKRRLKRYLTAQLREARRRAPARPPAIVHAVPASSPRPRERGARMVAAPCGRDGTAGRDDGGGGEGDSGGGSEPPARSRGVRVLERGGQS